MEIVVAHNNMDFDSLAAQFAVTKLYPGTRMAPGNVQAPNLREFLTLYRDLLPIVDLQYVDVEKITHVFIVDCQNIDRIDDVPRKLITQKLVTHTLFDHHPPDAEGLAKGARQDSSVKAVGSCTAMLVGMMMEKGIELEPFEATLLLIGIYEDTGCMTYSGTTELDARSVAFLLTHGADLNQVNNFINPKLGQEQTDLFQTLIANAKPVTISGAKVMLAHAKCEKYIEGLATLTRRLLEVSSASAAITVVFMRDRTHIVGRSDTPAINVRTVVREFGGDGHAGAASAVTKETDLPALLQKIEQLVAGSARPEPVARELMSTPVRTITPEAAMDEAGRLMLRYGHDGLVVMEEEQIVGVVSKRDVDKANHHKLAHAPVRGFMSTPAIFIEEQTPLSEIQSMMVSNDIGRLPVVDQNGKLIGIVTRKEVLSTLFGSSSMNEIEPAISPKQRRIDFREKLKLLDEPTEWLFQTVGELADQIGMKAYAVGGCIRDMYLGRPNFDLDFVIEGSAIDLASVLEEAYPGRFEVVAKHERFNTATLVFSADTKREVDLSTARTEFYEFPAALPTVEAAVLEHDLFRRDFTINALALALNKSEYGFVFDFFNGVSDIDARLIRILHPFSFIEDPTRIVRAVRFASRLNFELEERTKQLAHRAIEMGMFDNLGGFRLKEELRLMFESAHRIEALELLDALGGGLRYLAANLSFDETARQHLKVAERILSSNRLDRYWIVYLGTLLAPLPSSELERVIDRLVLANDEREWIRSGIKLTAELHAVQSKTPANSEIYSLLHGYSDQALSVAASLAKAGSPSRDWIKHYLDELRGVRTSISGNDLIRIGFPQGPLIKEALQELHVARLNGEVQTPAQEFEFIKRRYPQFAGSER